MNQSTLPTRSEITPEFTWDAESVFADAAAWEREYESLGSSLEQAAPFRGQLASTMALLANALETFQEHQRRLMILVMYAGMQYAVDSKNEGYIAMHSKAAGLMGRALAAWAFLEPELIAIGLPKLLKWSKTEPRLAMYAHYFDNLFRRQAHVRSAEVEELLGLLADPFSGPSYTNSQLTSADLKFPPATDSQGKPHPLAQGTRDRLLVSTDRELRRTAWENYYGTYLAFKNTSASQLGTSIKQNVFLMRARHYGSTLEMALDEQNLTVPVFHNLIQVFRENLPTWHRYWRLRRKALELAELRPYDVVSPLTPEPDEIPFKQAVEWICAGLEPMGSEYVEIVRRGCLEERWVDLYPGQGKKQGAFSWGAPGTHPFIVMNYNNTVHALSVLAHELGHSMHSYYSWQAQPIIYTGIGTFVAEVASNFHQALVRAYLLRTLRERNLLINLIEEAMSNFHRYFFIMPTLARFEYETHRRVERGEALTADAMIDLCANLFAEGYGMEVQFDRARVGMTWATFDHLYTDYYVFQYATGISGANALARRILEGAPGAVESYIGFLKAGSSKYPLDALRDAGVDLSRPEPVHAAFQMMAGYVDRLEGLIEEK